MKLSAFKAALDSVETLTFITSDGRAVAPHFHVTEVGHITKHFIDCGGVVRQESKVNFQLFVAHDVDHRLAVSKLRGIVKQSERTLSLPDAEIEVEYQGSETIGKYSLDFDGARFMLIGTATDCLAKDGCGIPVLQAVTTDANVCTPGGGCC